MIVKLCPLVLCWTLGVISRVVVLKLCTWWWVGWLVVVAGARGVVWVTEA